MLDVCAASTLVAGIAETVDIPVSPDPRAIDAAKIMVAIFFNAYSWCDICCAHE
jgi:hypothetical protein